MEIVRWRCGQCWIRIVIIVIRISLNHHLVKSFDVILGYLDRFKLAEFSIIAMSGQKMPQIVKGRIELSHPLSFPVIGIISLLFLFLRCQLPWSWASFLWSGRRAETSLG